MQSDTKPSKTHFILVTVAISLTYLLISFNPVHASQDQPNPVYIIQPGETLTDIANRFGVSISDLKAANGIINADLISIGTSLIIPGLEGVSGVLTTKVVAIAESLEYFIKKENTTLINILRLNKITSPNEVYAGSTLIIPVDETKNGNTTLHFGGALTNSEFALLGNINPWLLFKSSDIEAHSRLLARDIISIDSDIDLTHLETTLFNAISISPLPFKQGSTHIVKVILSDDATISGYVGDTPLAFFENGNEMTAIQGIFAMAEPGLVRFSITANNSQGKREDFEQMVLLVSGNFISDPPIIVSDQTIDPAITQPENDFILSLVNKFNVERYWEGKFIYPVDEPIGFMSIFGSRRSYNNSGYTSFHTGLDFGVYANSLNIYAAAAGKVVFAGSLTVRGNTVFIDHGHGIFSGYFHQSEIKVKEGDFVNQGQLIGLIGATGRVTGPHLHWEIWANGFQVNPINWVENLMP